MSNRKRRVYLAGLIRRNVPECFTWRKQATERLSPYFTVVDPTRGKTSGPDEWANDFSIKGISSNAILLRDYKDVCSSDVVLVNLYSYSGHTVLGTLIELGWAWERRIPIVSMSLLSTVNEHPFLDGMIAGRFLSVKEACLHIGEYYR